MKNLSQEQFCMFCLPVPSKKEQDLIISFLSQETAKIDTLIAQSNTAISLLQERRTALISAAVTGQIDVRGFQPVAV